MREQPQRKPALFGWLFATAFCGVPTLVLVLLSTGLRGEAAPLLRRFDALESGLPAGERFVTGQAQPAPGHTALVSPVFGRTCLAWEAQVWVSWTSTGQNEEQQHHARVLRAAGAATRIVVLDERAGVLATIDAPRVTLDGAPATERAEPVIPAWSEGFEHVGADVTAESRSYSSSESVLEPGETVSFFARNTDPVSPLADQPRLVLFRGTPEAWRAEVARMATAATWLGRIGAALGALTLVFALGLGRAVWRRRAVS